MGGVSFALGWADFDAEGAAGAIFGSNLQRVELVVHAAPFGLDGLEG
jgi:hypothetical protein